MTAPATDRTIAGVVVLLRVEPIPSEHEGAIHVEKNSPVACNVWRLCLTHR